jgi:hypothetical protein
MYPTPSSNPLHALAYRGHGSNGPGPNRLIRALLLFLSVFALAVAPAPAQSFSYSDLGQMQVGVAPANYVTPLTPASNGMFYSISTGYGSTGDGYIYMVDTFGNSTDILDFAASDATAGVAIPIGNLIQGPDGFLYGTTLLGGQYNWGVFYKVWVDGSNFQVLYSFDGETDGGAPIDGITLASDGNFYAIGNSVYYSDSTSSTNHPYHSAASSLLTPQKKGSPHQFLRGLPLHRSSAIAARSKSHAHPDEGPSGCSDFPYSSFYQLTTSGNMTELYCEAESNGLREVTGPLVETSPLQFYDMTSWSNTFSAPAIFTISGGEGPEFLSATPSGDYPGGGLTAGTDGNFYMTYNAYKNVESSGCDNNNVVGVLQAAFSEGIIFTANQADCSAANTILPGLFLATDGGLYGASESSNVNGNGQILRFDIGESSFSAPHQFVTGSGIGPISIPAQASDGNFYGDTWATNPTTPYGPNVFYSLDAIPNMPAPLVLTTSDPTPPALSPMTLTWQVNNASWVNPPVCVALIDDQDLDGGGGWSQIQTGYFSGNVYSGVTDVIAPPWPGTYEYQLVCNGQGSVETQITVPYVFPTATTVAGTSNISVGQTTTFTANVQVNYNNPTVTPKNGKSGASPKYNNNRPTMTGNVTFTFNNVVLGRVRVQNGQASISMPTTTLPYGTYTITAAYSGDNNYHASSTSNPYQVNGAPTNVVIATSVLTVDIGSPITLYASVGNSVSDGVASPSGTVTFLADNNPIGTVNLVSGSATLSPSTAAVVAAVHQYSVYYNGDALHSTNAAVPVAVNVLKNSTRTNMTVGTNPVLRGQSETLTASVVSAYLVPTGNVCFFAGNTNLGCAPLISGVATFTAPTSGVKAATYPVHAEYSSDLVHNVSKSRVTQIIVHQNLP